LFRYNETFILIASEQQQILVSGFINIQGTNYLFGRFRLGGRSL